MTTDPLVRYTSERPRYFDRQVLRAEDLGLEQAEVDRRRRQLTRFLHGWGIVAGFRLDAAAGSTDPTQPPPEDLSPAELRVAAGFAVTPLGTELFLPEAAVLDDILCRIPPECRPAGADCELEPPGQDPALPASPITVYVIAEPASRGAAPMPARPEGCHHPGNNIAMSRTCDGIALRLICGPLAPPHDAPPVACEINHDIVCGGEQMSEPEVPMPPVWTDAQDFVVLGALLVDGNGIIEVGAEVRRRLLPVDVLQRRLECLCAAPAPTQTASPTPTRTSTPTQTPTVTFQPTRTFHPTLTVGPTLTATFEPTLAPTFQPTRTFQPTLTMGPTLTATFEPTRTFGPTFGPTFRPTGGPTRGPVLTVAPPPVGGPGRGGVVDPVVLEGLDREVFDVERGRTTGLDQLPFLADDERARLGEAGIADAASLHAADTGAITQLLGVSEVRAAELKTEAASAFRRADAPAADDPALASVRRLSGIGPRRGEALEGAGIGTVGRLAATPPERIGEVLGVRRELAQDIVTEARNLTGRGER